MLAKGIRHGGLFHLVDSHATALTMSDEPVDDLLHRRLGHANSATVNKLGLKSLLRFPKKAFFWRGASFLSFYLPCFRAPFSREQVTLSDDNYHKPWQPFETIGSR